MTIALIAVGAIIVIFLAAEVMLRLVAVREHARFAALSPVAKRKYQESPHKAQSYSNS